MEEDDAAYIAQLLAAAASAHTLAGSDDEPETSSKPVASGDGDDDDNEADSLDLACHDVLDQESDDEPTDEFVCFMGHAIAASLGRGTQPANCPVVASAHALAATSPACVRLRPFVEGAVSMATEVVRCKTACQATGFIPVSGKCARVTLKYASAEMQRVLFVSADVGVDLCSAAFFLWNIGEIAKLCACARFLNLRREPGPLADAAARGDVMGVVRGMLDDPHPDDNVVIDVWRVLGEKRAFIEHCRL